MKGKGAVLLIAVSALLSALAGCGGGDQAIEKPTADEPAKQEANTEATAGNDAGDTVSRSGDALQEGGQATEGSPADEDGSRKVTLRIGGSPGTKFSGTCVVGGEEKAVGGRAPERSW